MYFLRNLFFWFDFYRFSVFALIWGWWLQCFLPSYHLVTPFLRSFPFSLNQKFLCVFCSHLAVQNLIRWIDCLFISQLWLSHFLFGLSQQDLCFWVFSQNWFFFDFLICFLGLSLQRRFFNTGSIHSNLNLHSFWTSITVSFHFLN